MIKHAGVHIHLDNASTNKSSAKPCPLQVSPILNDMIWYDILNYLVLGRRKSLQYKKMNFTATNGHPWPTCCLKRLIPVAASNSSTCVTKRAGNCCQALSLSTWFMSWRVKPQGHSITCGKNSKSMTTNEGTAYPWSSGASLCGSHLKAKAKIIKCQPCYTHRDTPGPLMQSCMGNPSTHRLNHLFLSPVHPCPVKPHCQT